MKILILFLVLILAGIVTVAQNNKTVNVIKWSKTTDSKLCVEYSIINAKANETYELNINIYDDKKSKLTAFTLTGDYPKVTGAGNKKLYWDVLKDRDVFPIISSIKIEIKLVTYNQIVDDKKPLQEPNKVKPNQEIQNNYTNQNSQNQVNKSKSRTEEKTAQNRKQIYDRRKIFTMGILGGGGVCTSQEINAGSYGTFSGSGMEINYGGYMVIGHFGVDISKTERTIEFTNDNANKQSIDINSINGSLDFYTDMPASPKHKLGLILGFGIGSYTTTYKDNYTSNARIRVDEIGYYPKLGLMISFSKNFKFGIIDAYHFIESPVNDFRIAFYLGI